MMPSLIALLFAFAAGAFLGVIGLATCQAFARLEAQDDAEVGPTEVGPIDRTGLRYWENRK